MTTDPTAHTHTTTAIDNAIAALTARVAKLEAAVPPPVVTPPPTVPRPFAAPTITNRVAVKAGANIQALVDAAPNGTQFDFDGSVFVVSTAIWLDGRKHLVFAGNGSTIRCTQTGNNVRSSTFVVGWGSSCGDIAIRDFRLEGANNRTGTDIYDGGQESQMGMALYGGDRIEFTGNTVTKMNGDGVYANELTSTHYWPTDVWVHDNRFDWIGRNALTANSGRRLTFERNACDHLAGSFVDIEPDTNDQGIADLLVSKNTIGTWGMSPLWTMHFVACASGWEGTGATVNGVTIDGNTCTGGPPEAPNNSNRPSLFTEIGRPSRMSRIAFTNNKGLRSGAGPALKFWDLDGLTVTGNTQPVNGSLVSVTNCTAAVTSPNP